MLGGMMLFDREQYKINSGRPRKYKKRMHVVDASLDGRVVLACGKCELMTCWFEPRSPSRINKGIHCPRCCGEDFDTDENSDYVPNSFF